MTGALPTGAVALCGGLAWPAGRALAPWALTAPAHTANSQIPSRRWQQRRAAPRQRRPRMRAQRLHPLRLHPLRLRRPRCQRCWRPQQRPTPRCVPGATGWRNGWAIMLIMP
jgi:hypothetical protein